LAYLTIKGNHQYWTESTSGYSRLSPTDQFIPSTVDCLQSSLQCVIHSTHIRYRSSRNWMAYTNL